MRFELTPRQALSTVAAFSLSAALWGEAPQEAQRSRPQPRAATQGTGQAPRLAAAASRGAVGFQGRGGQLGFFPGTRTVVPAGWVRCTSLPDPLYWRHRDLGEEIQWMSRTGLIPVSPVGDGVGVLSDYVPQPAGWRAYGVAVPAGGTVQVEVQHPMLGWFRLLLVDKWGVPGPGMLEASIAHQPVLVTYRNPGKEATAAYFIVDDPAWWSDAKTPYSLVVRRDWDPAHTDLSKVQMVSGLWGATPSVSAEFRHRTLSGPAVYPR
jgi:hypothetical protein